MGLLNVGGISVLSGTITMPRVGVWRADLRLDSANAQSGTVTIATADGALSLKGTITQEAVFQNTLRVRIQGGAAGLPTTVPAKQFRAPSTMKMALQYVLGTCGETLDPSSDGTVTSATLNWVIKRSTGSDALHRLLDSVAVSWRVLPNGNVWVGTDTYPPAPSTHFDLLENRPDEARAVIGSDQPFLLPGVTLTLSSSTKKRVSAVVHEIGPSKLRSEVWFERK